MSIRVGRALALFLKSHTPEEALRIISSSKLGSRGCRRHFSTTSINGNDSRLEDFSGLNYQEYEKWCKGGGMFHKSAHIDPTAVIEIGAVIHPKSVLGANVYIGSGAVIGPEVRIGPSTKIGYNAVLCNCTIGDLCVVHGGVCIGQDGFGFFVDDQGNMVKKSQMLTARIGNHVEIGANTCIDRGSWRETVIGDHTKIDNLVQIGHNVVIGKCCMLCGQVGIAGSVTMGDYVVLGGRAAIRDHVSIVSRVRLAANSCVTKDIKEPGDYGGFPAVPAGEWRRQVAAQHRASN
ncbi:Hexapeptide repeat [Dillenia turbinata]|uniref:Hexapeptide repeat n=1 Tax=Dillenia turbinata TaxID=194707 RepID=A0AAN8Z1K9_9MAGN